ncbi:MAG TPA: Ig-like domain-containing protein [Myxococcota bacterium]|nr:Ig-like domain-containing protein [Myxococcota bacterium]HRY92622.1 Ig-like domain-containing protein [Myxococcota bacterium]
MRATRTRKLLLGSLALLALAGLLGACGDPVVEAPDALEVVYLPLDGAVDVDPAVQPMVYFSGAVDGASISETSVLLASATPGAEGCLEVTWTELGSGAAVDAMDPALVLINPATASQDAFLLPQTCYRLTLTTAVKGSKLGPLADLGIPERPGIGAEATFQTAPAP